MTRLSIAVAAALLVLPNAASAKIPVLDLGAFCDFMPIVIDHSQAHGFSNWTCQSGCYVGLIANANSGERSVIANIQVKHMRRYQFLLQLSYPLVDGGTWSVFYTRNGYTMKLYKSGTYNVDQ